MTQLEIDVASIIFQKQCSGIKLGLYELEMLKSILDSMNEAEKAGSVAAIIRIMLQN